MVNSESDTKSHLITHICDLSNHAKSCAHNTFDSNNFIDWYILLQIEDNVGVDIIRKKYHKYALLLHPDKNNHPKAEFAFKLVSQAYACLSDEGKRLEFDVKRLKNVCNECIKIPQMKTKVKGSPSPFDRSRSKKISLRMKEVKVRLMEEAKVIEKCLKANANGDVFDKEMPVFDPNNYGNHRYPHFRVLKSSKWLKEGLRCNNNQQQQTKVKCDSPIFECKPKRSSIKLKI